MYKNSYYKYCIVPGCCSSTTKTSEKVFFSVPKDSVKRKAWMTAMKRGKLNELSPTSSLYCCEDHFSLPDDMYNYCRWKLMKNVLRIQLKAGVIPHIFECQKKKHLPANFCKRKNLHLFSEVMQKELAAQREAGLLSDAAQEATDSVQSTSANTSITGEISSVSQDISIPLVRLNRLLVEDQVEIEEENSVGLSQSSAALEISGAVQETSTKHPSDSLQKNEGDNETDTNSAVENSSTASNNVQKSSNIEHSYTSQAQLNNQQASNKNSSASVTNNSALKSTKSTIENCSAIETVNNIKSSSSVDQNRDGKQQTSQSINSSPVPVSSASVKDSHTLSSSSVAKNDVESSSADSATVSNNTSQSVSATDSNILPVISDSGSDFLPKISSDCSSPVCSGTTCDSNTCLLNSKDLKQRVLRSHCSAASSINKPVPLKVNQATVATQINDHIFKVPKKLGGKRIKKLQPLPKEVPIHGRRIIDFQYFFRALKFINNHSIGKSNYSKTKCNLNNIMIIKEEKSGISSCFHLKCAVCNYKRVLWSESPTNTKKDVTADFVSGILKIKGNFEAASVLLAEMYLPSLTYAHFVDEFVKVYKANNPDKYKQNQGVSENVSDNIQGEAQPAAVATVAQPAAEQQCPSASENNNLLQQVDLDDLVVEDQIEIKQENSVENDSESETIIPDQRERTSDSMLITCQEQPSLNTTIVKQEVNSDDEDLTNSIINDSPNKESVVDNAEQNMFGEMPSSQNEARVCESEITVNPKQINLDKSVSFENDKDGNTLVKPEFVDMEITTKESTPDFNNKQEESELPLKKKAKIVRYEELSNPPEAQRIPTATDKEIPFFQNRFESGGLTAMSSTGVRNLPSSFSRSMEGTAPASSVLTEGGGNATFTSAQNMHTYNGSEALIALQNMASRSHQGAKGPAFLPGTSPAFQQHTSQSNSGTKVGAFPSGTATTFQQHTGQPNRGLLPLINMHQSWSSNFNTPVNNPLILFSGGTPYMTGIPVPHQFPRPTSNIVIPQPPASSANSVLNVRGGRYVPLVSSGVQQPVDLSNDMPGMTQASFRQPALISNAVSSAHGSAYVPYVPPVPQQSENQSTRPPVYADRTRWIGRPNMSSNNPFCTLPGGAPKGVPDPDSPKSDGHKSSQHSKRPKFHCDDCDVSFAKHESWDSHNKFYCIKRLKVPPSSTVTNHSLMDISSPPNSTTQSFKSPVEELLSAMAVKRSFLETSMKTALDAQYVINLHKSAQELTQKSFKELDDALTREKALMPEASLEEQQVVSEARAQALIRAEAAYKQEKHSAAIVQQALYRQKSTIEATLAATGHEQTALISTLKGLNLKTNQNIKPSVLQAQCNASYGQTSFEEEKLFSATSAAQTVEEQQVDDDVSPKSVSIHETSLSRLDYFVQHINENDTTSHVNVS